MQPESTSIRLGHRNEAFLEWNSWVELGNSSRSRLRSVRYKEEKKSRRSSAMQTRETESIAWVEQRAREKDIRMGTEKPIHVYKLRRRYLTRRGASWLSRSRSACVPWVIFLDSVRVARESPRVDKVGMKPEWFHRDSRPNVDPRDARRVVGLSAASKQMLVNCNEQRTGLTVWETFQ